MGYDHPDTIKISKEEKERNKNKFYRKEYVISEENQILPLYAVIVKRFEYLIIWRAYNFNDDNPNNFSNDLFNEIQEFSWKN